MSLTRKMLKAMGIEDEKIDQIIEAHTETVDALKEQRDSYKADAEKLPEVQKELDGLKAAGDDGYKEKYEAEHTAFEQYKADQTAKETRAAKESAYRKMLKAAGVSEKRIDTVMRASGPIIDGLELAEDGKAKDADKLTEGIKAEWADFIPTTTTQGAPTANPPAVSGGKKLSKDDIFRKDDRGRYVMGTAERQRAIAENLDAFSGGNN